MGSRCAAGDGTYDEAMVDRSRTMSKVEATKVLRGVGFSWAQIGEILGPLGDPIDLDRDGAVLAEHGVTRQILIDRMGGSP